MQPLRIILLAFFSTLFVVTATFWKKAIAIGLCGILSFNSGACYSFLGQNGRADAAALTSGAVVNANLVADAPKPVNPDSNNQALQKIINSPNFNALWTGNINCDFSNMTPVKTPAVDFPVRVRFHYATPGSRVTQGAYNFVAESSIWFEIEPDPPIKLTPPPKNGLPSGVGEVLVAPSVSALRVGLIGTVVNPRYTPDSKLPEAYPIWTEGNFNSEITKLTSDPNRSSMLHCLLTLNAKGGKKKPDLISQSNGNEIQQKIVQSINQHYGESTAVGPEKGRSACAWELNRVLQDAVGHTIGKNTNYAPSVESALQSGDGTQVTPTEAHAGDIVVFDNTDTKAHHIGFCLDDGCTKVISNSSTNASFTWVGSRSSYDDDFEVNSDTHIYRVNK